MLNMPQWQKYAVPVDLLVEAKKMPQPSFLSCSHFCEVAHTDPATFVGLGIDPVSHKPLIQ